MLELSVMGPTWRMAGSYREPACAVDFLTSLFLANINR